MLNTQFSPWPSYSEEECLAAAQVLRSNKVNYWTGGQTRKFEKEFAEASGTQHAIALANGTLALELALRFLVGPGDEVIVTPRSFIASASSVVTVGAIPVFADVDRDTQNLSATTIAKAITPRTRAIIVVHLAGMPADMDPIMELAKKHGLKVIEDCAQAHGAKYKNLPVGSIGDAGAWSFCQDKIMTTGGEGGMVTVNDKALWAKMWAYKDHGKSWDTVNEEQPELGYRWLHESFGTNWRMTEMQAVIGRIQLKKLDSWQASRAANAERIWNACRTTNWLRVPQVPDNVAHAAYKAYVFIEPRCLPAGWDRDAIIDSLISLEVPAYSGSCSEVYLEKAFENTSFRPAERLPTARELGERSLMFLCHPTLTKNEIDMTCDAIHRIDRLIQAASSDALSCIPASVGIA